MWIVMGWETMVLLVHFHPLRTIERNESCRKFAETLTIKAGDYIGFSPLPSLEHSMFSALGSKFQAMESTKKRIMETLGCPSCVINAEKIYLVMKIYQLQKKHYTAKRAVLETLSKETKVN